MASAVSKLSITKSQLRAIESAAEAAYPEESCGLLVGEGADLLRLTALHPSPNLAEDRRRRFEVDPALLSASPDEAGDAEIDPLAMSGGESRGITVRCEISAVLSVTTRGGARRVAV